MSTLEKLAESVFDLWKTEEDYYRFMFEVNKSPSKRTYDRVEIARQEERVIKTRRLYYDLRKLTDKK